jgi:hypothetical protein
MRVLGVAFGLVCIALQVEGSGDDVKQAIANKVIEFAKCPHHAAQLSLRDLRP